MGNFAVPGLNPGELASLPELNKLTIGHLLANAPKCLTFLEAGSWKGFSEGF